MSAELANYEISSVLSYFHCNMVVFMAFEVTSDITFESYGINLVCYHALLALFHVFHV